MRVEDRTGARRRQASPIRQGAWRAWIWVLGAGLGLLSGPAAGCIERAPIEGAACDREHPCPDGFGCAGGSCRRLEVRALRRCYEDDDCGIGVCLVELGFCVQCVADRDCGGLMACIPGAFVCGCVSASQCATGRCDAASGACVGCLADAQCDSGRCDPGRGICEEVDDAGEPPEEKAGGPR